MSESDLTTLVALFERTHEALGRQAARAVDAALVVRNWLFGYYLVEYEGAGASRKELYGKQLIDTLSVTLRERGIKGTSATNLRRFRAFYEAYPEIQPYALVESSRSMEATTEIQPETLVESQSTMERLASDDALGALVQALRRRFTLGWTHYLALYTVRDLAARRFYEIEAAANGWNTSELERQIASALYERLALSRDKDEIRRLAEEGQVVQQAADLLKNPYVLEFLGYDQQSSYSERELETAIIDKLEHFLLELGKGFLFEARQKRFSFDNDHFYVDLVFYNRLLRCYVLIDLKIDKLTHQDLGQMQMYVNYFDRYVRTPGEAPTIGILLCQRKSDALVELTLPEGSNIHASEYQTYLPSKEELQRRLMAWTKEIES
jgi:predicted nuclease of restriction endonuclease-like (RecB) superfamily